MPHGKKTGGRTPGTPNKATADIRAAAALHGTAALEALAEIAAGVENPPAARVSAAVALLDRGYGRPAQAVELTGKDGGPVAQTNVTPSELASAVRSVQDQF
jgi:hypothetical protein